MTTYWEIEVRVMLWNVPPIGITTSFSTIHVRKHLEEQLRHDIEQDMIEYPHLRYQSLSLRRTKVIRKDLSKSRLASSEPSPQIGVT